MMHWEVRPRDKESGRFLSDAQLTERGIEPHSGARRAAARFYVVMLALGFAVGVLVGHVLDARAQHGVERVAPTAEDWPPAVIRGPGR